MSNRILSTVFLLAAVFMVGCAATENVQLKAYLQDQPRVDQNREQGNSGYIFGMAPEDGIEHKKTRKVIVVEANKKSLEVKNMTIEEEYINTMIDDEKVVTTESTVTSEFIEIPDMDNKKFYADEPFPNEPTNYTEYTIENNDTLQKISKKFYDSYSQWIKIYDANRDVIANPDSVMPGTKIRIPIYE